MIMACALAPLLLCAEVEQMGMASWRVTPPQCVQVGDLVFRRDQGMWSWLFIDASRREKRFSHVGVVVACGQDPLIVHADADERTGTGCVRQQPWRAFFAESRDAAVYRYAGDKAVRDRFAQEALGRIGVPFDTGFDMTDTNKLYCSELVRESLNAAARREVIKTTILANATEFIALDNCYETEMIKIAECVR